MPATLIGAHMPTSGGLGDAVRKGKQIGCTAIQVFTSSPRMWKTANVTDEKVVDFLKAQQETGITDVVSHDSYLINLCAPTEEIRIKSEQALKEEMRNCGKYGIEYTVSHVAAHKDQPYEEAFACAAGALQRVLDDTPDNVTLLMETTAGQGSTFNAKFEELAKFLEQCKGHPRLCVCLDTCHIFVAGYDIRTPETYAKTFEEFDRIVGLDRLKCIHCNDSKKGLGSRVDRHEHIGEGEIGIKTFELLVNDDRFEHIPILIETPDGEEMHQTNVQKLWSLVRS